MVADNQTTEQQETDIFTCPGPVVLPVAGDPLSFEVRISDSFYRVFIGSKTLLPRCECPDHAFRKLGTLAPCKHLTAAQQFVAQGKRAAADAATKWFLGLSEEERLAIWR